jgi:hypothetical protein
VENSSEAPTRRRPLCGLRRLLGLAVGFERLNQRAAETLEKWLAPRFKPLLQAGGAVAVDAGPRLRAIVIAAAAPVVGVLNSGQLKVLFPVRPLFEQGCGTEANLNPAGCAIVA